MTSAPEPWNGFRVIPLVLIDDADQVLAVVDALLAGGIGAIEIGLRTPQALDAIEIAAGNSHITVSAGTIIKPEQVGLARSAGAQFGIAPTGSRAVIEECQRQEFMLIPAIATPTEAHELFNLGFKYLKVFPADLVGGNKFTRAIGSVLPEVRLMPSGGVGADNLAGYLSEPNVFAVSGSWIAPRELIAEKNYSEITKRASQAMQLVAEVG